MVTSSGMVASTSAALQAAHSIVNTSAVAPTISSAAPTYTPATMVTSASADDGDLEHFTAAQVQEGMASSIGMVASTSVAAGVSRDEARCPARRVMVQTGREHATTSSSAAAPTYAAAPTARFPPPTYAPATTVAAVGAFRDGSRLPARQVLAQTERWSAPQASSQSSSSATSPSSSDQGLRTARAPSRRTRRRARRRRKRTRSVMPPRTEGTAMCDGRKDQRGAHVYASGGYPDDRESRQAPQRGWQAARTSPANGGGECRTWHSDHARRMKIMERTLGHAVAADRAPTPRRTLGTASADRAPATEVNDEGRILGRSSAADRAPNFLLEKNGE